MFLIRKHLEFLYFPSGQARPSHPIPSTPIKPSTIFSAATAPPPWDVGRSLRSPMTPAFRNRPFASDGVPESPIVTHLPYRNDILGCGHSIPKMTLRSQTSSAATSSTGGAVSPFADPLHSEPMSISSRKCITTQDSVSGWILLQR
jgi:hypothetical protein